MANPWPALRAAGALGSFDAVPTPMGSLLQGSLGEAMKESLGRVCAAGRGFHRLSFFGNDKPQTPSQVFKALRKGNVDGLYINPPGYVGRELTSLEQIRACDVLATENPDILFPEERQTYDKLAQLHATGQVETELKYLRRMAVNAQNENFRSELTVAGNRLTVESQEDIDRLLFFYADGTGDSLGDPDTNEILRQAEKAGLKLAIRGHGYTANNAYRISRYGRPHQHPIEVSRDEGVGIRVPLQRLTDLKGLNEELERFETVRDRVLTPLIKTGYLRRTELPDIIFEESPGLPREVRVSTFGELASECIKASPKFREARDDQRGVLGDTPADIAAKFLQHAVGSGNFVRMASTALSLVRSHGPEQALEKMAKVGEALQRSYPAGLLRERAGELFNRLFEAVPSAEAALEGAELVEIPSGPETLDQRIEAFQILGQKSPPAALHRTAANFRTLLARRLPNESLSAAATKFASIIAVLPEAEQDFAPSIFSTVQSKANGQVERADELAERFVKNYLTTNSLAESIRAAEFTDHINISSDGDFVDIGSFTLQVHD